jgi:hypothetical protein
MERMLTTSDNPYNPYIEWDEWFEFDTVNGYNTCAYLARVSFTSDALSESEEEEAIDKAIDEILELNSTGNYISITKPEITQDEGIDS